MNLQSAWKWTIFWICSSLLFACFIACEFGLDDTALFLSSYITEKMLSFDNLFMFYVIFDTFNLNNDQQRKALNYGVVGSFILRALFIFSGCALLKGYPYLLYPFAVLLFYTGLKIFVNNDDDTPKPPNKLINRLYKLTPLPVFWVCIATIELTDILFACDSIPAIFGITTKPWIAYTSNMFAVLGLRSMYFVILGLIDKFKHLPIAIACILMFIAFKIALSPVFVISPIVSINLILAALFTAMITSRFAK